MEDEAPVKTEGDAVARLEGYTIVHTLIKVAAEALVYTQAETFAQVKGQEVYRDTETLLEVEPETL